MCARTVEYFVAPNRRLRCRVILGTLNTSQFSESMPCRSRCCVAGPPWFGWPVLAPVLGLVGRSWLRSWRSAGPGPGPRTYLVGPVPWSGMRISTSASQRKGEQGRGRCAHGSFGFPRDPRREWYKYRLQHHRQEREHHQAQGWQPAIGRHAQARPGGRPGWCQEQTAHCTDIKYYFNKFDYHIIFLFTKKAAQHSSKYHGDMFDRVAYSQGTNRSIDPAGNILT